MTVVVIVVLVPIVVFATTSFISTSLLRHTVQNRNMKALYLAQAGIHRAIYNITSAGSPGTPLNVPIGSDTIAVTLVNSCSNIYQLKSIGTSVQTTYPTQIKRTVFAQYDSSSKKVGIFQEGDGTGVPAPVCCNDYWWPFSEGSGTSTGTAPYVGTLGFTVGANPIWTTDRLGATGKALLFNNGTGYNNYVLVPDSNGLDLTTTGTIMAWVNSTTHVTSGMVQKGASRAYSMTMLRQNSTWGRLELYIGNTRRWQSPTNFIALNTWYHFAVSWGPGKVQGYKNGLPGTAVVGTYTAPVNTQGLYIGTATTAATAFKGKIDEVHIHPCQKTDAEIKAYYNATCAGSGATPCPQP